MKKCTFDPEIYKDVPLGMFHCPECGEMVLAGLPHPVNPDMTLWNGMELVRISDVGKEFADWLYGQTLPYVEDDPTPTDWAYVCDFDRFLSGLQVED